MVAAKLLDVETSIDHLREPTQSSAGRVGLLVALDANGLADLTLIWPDQLIRLESASS